MNANETTCHLPSESKIIIKNNENRTLLILKLNQQEAQLMLTTGSTRLAVSRGRQTWYHFGSIATFR